MLLVYQGLILLSKHTTDARKLLTTTQYIYLHIMPKQWQQTAVKCTRY